MSLLSKMVVQLPQIDVPGSYDPAAQAWTIEASSQMSPQKHHQEN